MCIEITYIYKCINHSRIYTHVHIAITIAIATVFAIAIALRTDRQHPYSWASKDCKGVLKGPRCL